MKKSNKGFTLVELIIVIAILAIIMLIAIPNFSGIQQRMKVRADKATAAQIGKAVRVWYTDYTSDTVMKAAVDAKINATGATTYKLDTTPRVYSTIEQIDGYAALTYTPKSLLTAAKVPAKTQVYEVKLSDSTNTSKVIVIIDGTAETGDSITAGTLTGTEVNYDGTKSGIAYVEP